MCDMPWYKKMTCVHHKEMLYGSYMQHVKIIKYATYMVHKIFVQATLNTWNSDQHFPNRIWRIGTHIAMNT
jgi:hypothetical protein